MTAIAIVGMGCRFAGAHDLHSYWKMTLEGANGFGPPPPDRWDHEAFFSTSRRATDKSYAPNGGFIEDIQSFPALHFGIPPRRVEVMDPQQRFAIEVGLQAIQDAGYRPSEMPHRTGVYMGVTASEYRELLASRVIAQLMAQGATGTRPEDVQAIADAVDRVVPSRPFSAPGALANMIAAAVAQELDLHGPAYTTDAACASAMVALNDAIAALRTGQVDAALAGGVYVCVTPSHHIAFSRIGAISGSGACRPFDHRADGFVQGDGAGIVVLKRLEDAQRDGDRIYATIHGVAVNNDGRGDGPMAPVMDGQAEVIRTAWKDAGLTAENLGYIETHGTGTDVGDVTEFQGLMAALGDQVQRAVLGSSKANVGHTMSAAAVAGVIRAALAVHHRQLPPMGAFEASKDELGLDASPFAIPTAPESWDAEERLACVSSFGFGGTNGHLVMGPAPDTADSSQGQVELVRLSACDEASLERLAAETADALEREPRLTVPGVARAWEIRPQLTARLAIPAASREELIEALRAYAAGKPAKGTAFGEAPETAPKIALLFPGQGAQRVGMLGAIKDRFPVVAQTLAEMGQAIDPILDVPLADLLYPGSDVPEDEATERITDTARCQPALFACGQALWALLQQVGLQPVVATGHSLGEFNAAVVGGAMSPRDAAIYTARRGAAMGAVPGDGGTMAAIRAGADKVAPLLVEGAVIANRNHPKQVVVSGETDAVREVAAKAEAAGMTATELAVSHAFHSPIFESIDGPALREGLTVSDPTLPVASGIADRPWADAADGLAVLDRHAKSPVDFEGALRQCAEAGADLYLQVGAGGPLASFARKSVGRDARAVLTLASMDDDDGGRSLLSTLGWLWVYGAKLDLSGLVGQARVASVPPIPLPREPYWAVKVGKQMSLKIQETTNREPTEPAAAAPVVEEAAPSGDDVEDKVIDVLARVSSYPRKAVQSGLKLVDDLGFDSLMVADLATGLAEAFPGLGGLPQELLINSPTVQDIVDHVRGARGGGAAEIDDDEPLSTWAPIWRPTPFGDAPTAPDLSGKPALVVGDGARADAIAAALADAGAEVSRCGPAESGEAEVTRILVWCVDHEHPSASAVLAGEHPVPDDAATLIAAADRQAALGSAPDLLLVRNAADPWAAAMSGAVRAIAREWPQSVVKTLVVDGPSAARLGELLLLELASEDRSVDVRWARKGRSVLGFERAPARDLTALGEGDTVLITGGTRGIGARLAQRLAAKGARCLLVGRSDPGEEAAALIAEGKAVHLRCDVTDREALVAAVEPHRPVKALVHSAGILADGPLGQVAPERGAMARRIKVEGWLNGLVACGRELEVALGIGSWAGRFGNRHQAHYAAANAQLADLATHAVRGVRAVVAEFGPWTNSEMVRTIPPAIRAAMRAEGVDFVGDEAGLDALEADLAGGFGVAVHGRRLPHTTRVRIHTQKLSVDTHPYLADHAIDGTPVLPLAAAADLIAEVAGLPHPFEIVDLKLFSGITAREPIEVIAKIDGERAELRAGPKRTLAYTAKVRPAGELDEKAVLEGGSDLDLDVKRFYEEITFHGPLLAGIAAFDGAGPDFARGRVITAHPSRWIPGTDRAAFSVDPLALDSAFQLSAMVAWERYRRAGTPVGIQRLVQLAPWPTGELHVDVHFGEIEDNRFEASFWIRDAAGKPVAVAEGVTAELRKVDSEDAEPLVIKPEWVDPSTWSEVRDLELRLEGAGAMGIRNPFFTVHQGTARNTTQVDGKELINFSSYNYVGLSGDPEILEQVKGAVDRYGTSVSASRVASGERPFHGELERELAACQRTEDSLVFTAGHATNVTTIGHLFGPKDLILHDELIHDSALQGIKLAGSGRRGFKHDDPAHLEQLLKDLRPNHEKVLIVVEGVYSMDGDICQLPAYIALKKKYGCMLMVDEAHSFGIIGKTGCGAAEHFDIDGRDVDIWMGTLSKSLASCGGWIAGRESLIRYLRYTAPGFVYSAGITPANGVAALAALRKMLAEPWRVEKLQDNARFFHDQLTKRGLDTGPALGGSAVIPVVTGNSFHALMLSQRLVDQGINVQPIVYPAVADDSARLRFFLSSTHSHEELQHTAELVAKTLQGVRSEFAI